jgi:hypothetical protein
MNNYHARATVRVRLEVSANSVWTEDCQVSEIREQATEEILQLLSALQIPGVLSVEVDGVDVLVISNKRLFAASSFSQRVDHEQPDHLSHGRGDTVAQRSQSLLPIIHPAPYLPFRLPRVLSFAPPCWPATPEVQPGGKPISSSTHSGFNDPSIGIGRREVGTFTVPRLVPSHVRPARGNDRTVED